MQRNNLLSAYDLALYLDIDTAFTWFDTKTKSYTLIDGILISNELRDMVSDIRILTRDDNLSDHCPVELDTEVVITESLYKKKKQFRHNT